MFIATMILVRGIFKKYIYKMNRINPNPVIIGAGLLYFNIVLVSIIRISIYSIFIYQLALLFLYILIETINFEYLTKIKAKAELKEIDLDHDVKKHR